MKTFFCKNFKFTLALLAIISVSIATSCNKDESNKISSSKSSTQEQNPFGLKLDNNIQLITSLFLDKDATNYIDLSNGKLVTEQDHWDLTMNGMYASSINSNSALKGKLNFIDEEFKDVTIYKVLEKFGTNMEDFNNNFTDLKDFGMHHLLGDEEGWAMYDMSTHLVHPLPFRTLLLLSPTPNVEPARLRLFKIHITSMYENNILFPTPEDRLKVPYLNCRFEEIFEF